MLYTCRTRRSFLLLSSLFLFLFCWQGTAFAYHKKYSFDFDRASPPSDYQLFYGGSDLDKSLQNAMVCYSDSDPSSGACDTDEGKYGDPVVPGHTDLNLKFTEQHSGASVIVHLNVYRVYRSSAQKMECASDGMYTAINVMGDCPQEDGDSKFYFTFADPHGGFPYGGIWTAALNLQQYKVLPDRNKPVQEDTFYLTVKVTDDGNIQMYLPNLSGNKPTVDLGLVANPFAKPDATESGDATIESCLYDGYNSNSSKFTLTAIDPNSTSDAFSVTAVHPHALGADQSSEIQYQVFASDPGDPTGATTQMESGVPHTFIISRGAQFRPVSLQGIAGTVFCVPWSIHLRTPAFKQRDKQAGYYDGTLKVLFSPSTDQAP